MARLVKLFNEKQLLLNLQADTLILIRDCRSIEPIKKFVECHEILKLTWDIQERFPKVWPEPPECDEHALLHLRFLTQELFVGFSPELPRPGFDLYDKNVRILLRVFGVPRKAFIHARCEDGSDLPEEKPDMPYLYGVDASLRGPGDET